MDGINLYGGCMTEDGKSVQLNVSIMNTTSMGCITQLDVIYNGVTFRSSNDTACVKCSDSGGGSEFYGDGIWLSMSEPFRRWKLAYDGYLRSSATDKEYFVKLEGWVAASSDPFYLMDEALSAPSISLSFAEAPSFIKLGKLMEKFAQLSVLHQLSQITVRIDVDSVTDGFEEYTLKGNKTRMFGSQPNVKDINWTKSMITYFEDGTYVFLTAGKYLDQTCEQSFGFIKFGHGGIRPIHSFNNETFSASKWNRETILLIVHTDDGSYEIELNNLNEPSSEVTAAVTNQSLFDGESTLIRRQSEYFSTLMNVGEKKRGWSLVQTDRTENRAGSSIHSTDIPARQAPSANTRIPNRNRVPNRKSEVINLCHKSALCAELTGGKASKLAALIGLQSDFIVPDGLVVTTSAYDRFIVENEHLQALCRPLTDYGKLSVEELENHCATLREAFMSTAFPENLSADIEREMRRVFGSNEMDEIQFAIRSSAVGEDGAELSSAGQLETFLFQTGIQSVTGAILKCWASNFRREVVGYRRQHGQSLLPPVPVIVQRMVEADCGGVMFTTDPVSKDPRLTVLNGVRGIGESVVDGSVVPDSFRIKKLNKDYYEMESIEIGSSERYEDPCLTVEQAIRLTRIGQAIAVDFGAPQDIEWAFKNNEFYLLQSRPITSLTADSPWMYFHEFDSGILGHNDCPSTLNVGEVMPEAASPLGIEVSILTSDKVNQKNLVMQGFESAVCKHRYRAMVVYRNRMLFNLTESLYRTLRDFDPNQLYLVETIIAGHSFNDPRLQKFAQDRFPSSIGWSALMQKLNPIKILMSGKKFHDESESQYAHLKPQKLEEKNLNDLLNKELPEEIKNLGTHIGFLLSTSFYSSAWISICCILLKPEDPDLKEMSAEQLADVSTIFHSCQNVISADVPHGLKRVAREIVDSNMAKEFSEMTNSEAVEWLNHGGPPSVVNEYNDFMFDIGRIPWKDDQDSLIPPIQSKLILVVDRVRNVYREYGKRLHAMIDDNEGKKWEMESVMSLKGTAVCLGCVQGTARVVRTLEEAKFVKPGEILITTSTDIGWTPVFPIIAGIVTELGGLLSHGAAVAREYGLPCLIGVSQACHCFKTGDKVMLDAENGVIRKLLND